MSYVCTVSKVAFKIFPLFVFIFLFVTLVIGVSAHETAGSTVDACHADINQSGLVDLLDYTLLVSDFFETNPINPRSDIDHSGLVDIRDYSWLVTFFFKSCTPSSPSPTMGMVHHDHSIPAPIPLPENVNPVLVSKYQYLGSVTIQGVRSNDVQGMKYLPRKFTQAPYQGWDRLVLPTGPDYGVFRTYTGDRFLRITLQRAAKIVVIWDGSKIPTWLNSWTPEPNFNNRKAFSKVFPVGDAELGAIGGVENQPYTVLLAEANGVPSTPPKVPAGKETPLANESCPSWVHDRYVALAPDGKYYRTWHQPVDPVYWCYFHHEHGTNPALIGNIQVPFGYVTNRSDHFDPHIGFKLIGFQRTDKYTNRKLNVLFEVHFGTGTPERSCQRHHAVSMYVVDDLTKELMTRLTFTGDFGIPFKNGDIEDESTRIKCPNLPATIYSQTFGIKKPRVAPDNEGYENWRLGIEKLRLGIVNHGGLTFDTFAPQTGHGSLDCTMSNPNDMSTISCGTAMFTGSHGVGRFLGFNGDFIFDSAQALATGTFYTDEYGEVLRSATDMDATQQYIKPGFRFRIPPGGPSIRNGSAVTPYFTVDPWNMFYQTDTDEHSNDYNIEDSIRHPN